MRRLLFSLLVIASFAACKSEPATEQESVTQTRPITAPEGGPIVGPNKQPSLQTEQLFNFLSTGYWYIIGYSKINEPEAHAQNRGRWFHFSKEGTYSYGKLKETWGKGVWTYDPQNALLFLDSEKDADDGEWRLQMAKNGSAMVLVGTERFKQNSIQFKLENFIELMAEMPQPSN